MNIYKYHSDPESLNGYEERLSRVPKFAYQHAHSLGKRFPDGEPAIAKAAMYACQYAIYIIKERFPEGEPAIAKSAVYAYMYAKDVIGGRWPQGEAAIAKNALTSFLYSRDVIKGRFPEGEPAIANSIWKSVYEKLFNVTL